MLKNLEALKQILKYSIKTNQKNILNQNLDKFQIKKEKFTV